MAEFSYKRRDTAPVLARTLGVDVTGKTVDVVIKLRTDPSVRRRITGATVLTPSTGDVEATIPNASFLDPVGVYDLEWLVISGSGSKEQTVPPGDDYDTLTVGADL